MGNANARERHSTSTSENDVEISESRHYRKSFPDAAGHGGQPSEEDDPEKQAADGGIKIPTVFRWSGGGREVFLSGSFDDWSSRIPMAKSQGDFTTVIDLPEGNHEFKFLVDGAWRTSPNEQQVGNNFGTFNNVITVRHSDFEVFEALACDGAVDTSESGSIAGSAYEQVVPQVDTSSISQLRHSNIPPTLPPQLTQVLLNKESAQTSTDSTLPEPNHVMLNHLYALSIRDGVMAMGSTHRFKKKYVTTLLYKPVSP